MKKKPFIIFYTIIACLTPLRALTQHSQVLESCNSCFSEDFERIFSTNKIHNFSSQFDSLEFEFSYESEAASKGLLYISDAAYMKVVTFNKEINGGQYQPKTQLKSPYGRYLFPIELQKGPNLITVYIKQADQEPIHLQPKLYLNTKLQDAELLFLSKNENSRAINALSILLISLMLGFSIFKVLTVGGSLYRSYSLYLVSILTFLLCFSDDYLQWHFLFPNNLELYPPFNIIPQGIIYAMYAQFGLALFDVKKGEQLHKLCRVFQVLILGLSLFHAFYVMINFEDQSFIKDHFYKLYLIPLCVSTYMAILIVIKYKDSLKWFLLAGSGVITIGVIYELVTIFVQNTQRPRDFFYTNGNDFMPFSIVEISYVIESIIFLLGINYKNDKKERENTLLKEQVIHQLKEKEKLEREVNQLLTTKLESSERKRELEVIQNENERNKSLLMQSQLTSLQLQMNPHYLFNSLNSINDFIISKKPEEASEYLELYARMMRNILKTSDETFNTLEDELKFCSDYLDLESLRFNRRFSFSIKLPTERAILKSQMPTMLLQPILENAVWHGIMPFEKKGEIEIDTSIKDPNHIVIKISDTGNGFDFKEIEKKKDSYGLKNILDKIELLEKIYGKRIKLETISADSTHPFFILLKIPNLLDQKY